MIKQYPTGKAWAIFLVFLSLCAFACEDANDPNAISQAKKLYGKKIEFPTQYFSLGSGERIFSIDAELAKPLKIVTYLDKNSCSECALRILLRWEELLHEISGDLVGFIPVVYPNDLSDLTDALQILQINFPLFYDVENIFLNMNKLEKTLARNRTFLLDSNNKIIVIGEPLASQKLWQVYKNTAKSEHQ